MILFNVVIFKKIIETTIYIVIVETTTIFIIKTTIYNLTKLFFININAIVVAKSIDAIIT